MMTTFFCFMFIIIHFYPFIEKNNENGGRALVYRKFALYNRKKKNRVRSLLLEILTLLL